MKKSILFLAIFAVLGFAQAANATEGERARETFKKHFSGAENVQWAQLENDVQKASFLWGGHRTEAYFGAEGEFLGAIRGLLFQQLPIAVSRTLDQKFDKRVILEVREVTNHEGTSYTIQMEWKNKRYRVRLESDGSILERSVVKK